jgi:phosphoglycerate kinase
MDKKTIRDIDLQGKRVLVRVDFNVPLDGARVNDDTRVQAALPTLKAALDGGASRLVLMSHLGRPKGERKPEFSLAPVAPVLAELLGREVAFAADCVGPEIEEAAEALPGGGVLLLENTRFHPEEKANDPHFAAQLARLGDVYVNDAFGSAHRAHASTEAVARLLPAVAGLLMEKEIEYLANALTDPARPFVAILGGAKVSDKIAVIESLLDKADKLLIGGGMANTFFKAQGLAMGDSLVEDDALDTARSLLGKARDRLVLPTEVVIADAFSADANSKTVVIQGGVPDGWQVLDAAPATIDRFGEELSGAKLVVWNGPVGVFEFERFAHGTQSLAELVAKQTEQGAKTIIGGGDSAAAVRAADLTDQMSHISTGGGASLEMLEGKTLPGLAALNDR